MPRRPAREWGSVDRGKHRRAIELRKHHIPEAELVVWGKWGKKGTEAYGQSDWAMAESWRVLVK